MKNIFKFFGSQSVNKTENNSLLHSIANSKKQIEFGDYILQIDKSNPLSSYRKDYPLYDQFLPQICSSLNGLIIDIGANVGDTAISIFEKNTTAFVVGVEPDIDFGAECQNNINLNNLQDRFLLVQHFISTEKGNFQIDKSKNSRTGSMVKTTESTESNSLSFAQLIERVPENAAKSIDMLKVDTDGFDWDVLNSYCEAIADGAVPQQARFVFFEFQTFLNNIGFSDPDRSDRTLKYKKAILGLQENGYDRFCVFDNFGTHILQTSDIDVIIGLSDYMKRTQLHNKKSTIYHLDVLAYRKADENFIKEQLEQYLK